jgi:hypothetical protein
LTREFVHVVCGRRGVTVVDSPVAVAVAVTIVIIIVLQQRLLSYDMLLFGTVPISLTWIMIVDKTIEGWEAKGFVNNHKNTFSLAFGRAIVTQGQYLIRYSLFIHRNIMKHFEVLPCLIVNCLE